MALSNNALSSVQPTLWLDELSSTFCCQKRYRLNVNYEEELLVSVSVKKVSIKVFEERQKELDIQTKFSRCARWVSVEFFQNEPVYLLLNINSCTKRLKTSREELFSHVKNGSWQKMFFQKSGAYFLRAISQKAEISRQEAIQISRFIKKYTHTMQKLSALNPCKNVYIHSYESRLARSIEFYEENNPLKVIVHLNKTSKHDVAYWGAHKKMHIGIQFETGAFLSIKTPLSKNRVTKEPVPDSIFQENARQLQHEVVYIKNLKGVPHISEYLHFSKTFNKKEGFQLIEPYYNFNNLETAVRENGLNLSYKIKIILDLLQGIRLMHQQDIMHRDLKPKNVILHLTENDSLEAFITDFGAACFYTHGDEEYNRLCGTPLYLSPECLNAYVSRNDDELLRAHSFKRDAWALGAIIHEMMFSTVPERIEPVCPLEPLEKNPIAHLLYDLLRDNPDQRLSVSQAYEKYYVYLERII